MIQRLVIYLLAIIAIITGTEAQTSALQINSSGRVVVPGNGTFNTAGNFTAGNITSNGTINTVTETFSGNLTLASGFGAIVSIGNNTTRYGDASGTMSFFWQRLGVNDTIRGREWRMNGSNADANPGFELDSSNSANGNSYTYFRTYLNGGSYENGYSVMIDPSAEYGLSIGNGTAGKLRVGGATTLGGSGTAIQSIISASTTFDCPSVSANTSTTTTITVTGATTTNTPTVECTSSDETQYYALIRRAAVTSANTVTVYIFNPTAGAINPGSVTMRVKVTQF